MNLAAIRSTKWAKKEPFGSLWGYAASAFETFRTVSEEKFSEVRDTCDDARGEIGAKWRRGRE
jgi:hypothetical protein